MKKPEDYFKPVFSFFNVYDIIGYFAPGFIVIISYYYYFKYKFENVMIFRDLGSWSDILLIIISSYIIGNVISGLGKFIERSVNLIFPRLSIAYSLFYGKRDICIYSFRRASINLLDRFYKLYYEIFIYNKKRLALFKYNYKKAVRDLIKRKVLKPSDILWDCDNYLVYNQNDNYTKAYSFLSLSGFFRTTMLAWLIMFFPYCQFCEINAIDKTIAVLIYIFIIIALFNRYLKFERMFNYQIIRSMALPSVYHSVYEGRIYTITDPKKKFSSKPESSQKVASEPKF